MTINEIFNTMDYGVAPESREQVDRWLTKYEHQFQLFINNQWQKPQSEQYFKSVNPADYNETLAQIALANKDDVNSAVQAATAALPAWQGLSYHQRAKYLYALARQIQKHSRLFAVLESLDNGKPIRESRDIDIPLVARHFYHHAGWAQLAETELQDYEPVGVIGQIIPWNFPMLMMSWKIAPALAMGNTLVLKPAEYTSLTALLFAEICQGIQLPPGVVNIVTGAGETGAALVEHEKVNKIAFTGSTDVGKIIRRTSAGSGKKLSLELGGKSPFIVFEDADIDSVVEGVVDAIWFNQGQVCCAGSRILVQESIAERFIYKLKQRMSKLRVGDSLEKGIDIGAIVDKVQLDRIQELVQAGEKEGATLWQPDLDIQTTGCFFPPSLFTNVSPAHHIAQEEIFGPVVVSLTFRTPNEAVELANNTRYGLAASIWTENINLALDIAPKVKAGTIWINCTNVFDAASGFGGYRESGYGREGGKEGLYEYVKPKIEQSFSTEPQSLATIELANSTDNTLFTTIDRTPKLYIGGKQARPDSGYSQTLYNSMQQTLGEVPEGNRKDVRNAVEAAGKAKGWATKTGHLRAQILYFMAENLQIRRQEFIQRIMQTMEVAEASAVLEIDLSIERLFYYAAWADKYDGMVHQVPMRGVTLAMNEAVGTLGIICPDESPLLGFISTVAPAIAMGNTVVAIPSSRYPLVVTDFYQVLETSDLPAGVVNIVTGEPLALAKILAEHYDVEGIWYFGELAGSAMIEQLSADNMKRAWVNYGKYRDWYQAAQGQGREFLRHSTEVKNIWVPYGE